MLNRHYDVIVAGLRPGALVAAALLAKRGMRVLAVDQCPPDIASVDGYRFPSHDHQLLGFEDPLLMASILDELMVHPGKRRSLTRSDPSYQVLLPQQRVDVVPGEDAYHASLTSQFGEDAQVLIEALSELGIEAGNLALAWQQRRATLPSPSLLQRVGYKWGKERPLLSGPATTLGAHLDAFPLSAHARAFVLAQVAAFGFLVEPEALPIPIAAHLLLSARAGLYRGTTSRHAFRELLLGRLGELHGALSREDRVDGLSFKWGKVNKVSLAGHSQPYECDFLVWGSPWEELIDVLPPDVVKRYRGARAGAMPSQGRLCIHLVVAEEAIPVGMAEHVVSLASPYHPFEDGNLLTVSTSPPQDAMWAPEGERTLTLSTPVRLEALTPEHQHTVSQDCIAHLRTFMPFLDRHIRRGLQPPIEEPIPPSRLLWSAHDLGRTFPRDLGPGPRLPHWNLFHCGRGSYPLLGVEGEIAAGMVSVDSVLAAVR